MQGSKTLRRVGVVLVGALLSVGAGTAFPSAAASAAVSLAGPISSPAAANSPGDLACEYRPGTGGICVLQRDNGYDVGFASEVSSRADFNLETSSGNYGDDGWFQTSPGSDHSYFFSVGYKSWARACVYARDFAFAPLCTARIYT